MRTPAAATEEVIWNEPSHEILGLLQDLRDQMNGNKDREPTAEAIGLLYSAWHANKTKSGEDEQAYFHRVTGLLTQTFDITRFAFPFGNAPHLAFQKAVTKMGGLGMSTTVSLGFTLIVRRDESPEELAVRNAEEVARLEAEAQKRAKIAEIRKMKPEPRPIRPIR